MAWLFLRATLPQATLDSEMLGRITAAASSAAEAAKTAVSELTAEDDEQAPDEAAPVSPATAQSTTKKKLESATREDLVQFVKKQAVKMKSLESMGAELAQERRALDGRIVELEKRCADVDSFLEEVFPTDDVNNLVSLRKAWQATT